MAREKAKKEGIKAVRADKDKVVSMLFQAFEKHQYYRLIDLQKLTNQPPVSFYDSDAPIFFIVKFFISLPILPIYVFSGLH